MIEKIIALLWFLGACCFFLGSLVNLIRGWK